MMNFRKIIVVTLITVILVTSATVYATPSINIDNLQQNIETIIRNKAENAKAYLNIATELIKVAIAKFKDIKDIINEKGPAGILMK